MHIAFALFADAANLSQEGKLNILGVFDAVQVGTLPGMHPRAHLVLRFKGSRDDFGAHALTLQWLNPKGTELWNTTGTIDVGAPPTGVNEMDMPLVAPMDLPFDLSGTYLMRISLDDRVAAEIPLQVRAAAPPTVPAARGALVS